jgi:putative ABC transport system substrate-binding protein
MIAVALKRAGAAILAFGLVVLAPSVVQGQPSEKAARIGVLLFSTPATDPNLSAFLAGMRALGYADGRNAVYEYRYAEGHPERFRELAVQAAASRPDLIVVLGGDMVAFAKEATSTIPIVILTSNNPVDAGIIASFARPGGNITGVAFVASETAAKRLQFLKEAAPSVTRVAVLWNPDHPDGEYRDTLVAAPRLGVQIQSLEVRRPEEFEAALSAATRARADAMIVIPSRLTRLNYRPVIEYADRQNIPLVSGWGTLAEAGGLISYGPDLDDLARRAAGHVDKILKGAKPGDLPVEQPTKFELIVNLKTAKRLNLSISSSLAARADRVIQ